MDSIPNLMQEALMFRAQEIASAIIISAPVASLGTKNAFFRRQVPSESIKKTELD